jgi:mono/diheme cytochrome c family protein
MFKENCAACHGTGARRQRLPKSNDDDWLGGGDRFYLQYNKSRYPRRAHTRTSQMPASVKC